MKKVDARVATLFEKFFLGDNLWALLRFLVVLLSWILWIALIASVFKSRTEGFRHGIVPVGVVVCIIMLGARYVQDIYNLQSYSAGLRYILASFFGFGYPSLKIQHGKKKPDSDKPGLIEAIGGPGYLTVSPGNVVLLEQLHAPSSVCANGTYFLSRFERIGAIADLEEQQHYIIMTKATSKDGIPVTVQNVYFHYRLLPGRGRVRTPENPYPFSVQAVRDFAYNRAVTKDGLTHWEIAVKLAVDSALSAYINENRVDQITAPSQLENDPRYEMARRIDSVSIRQRLKDFGAELTWCDIGRITAGGEVDSQRMRAWQAKWNSDSTVVRAEGEAHRIEYEGVGRLEMQSDLLRGILNSLRRLKVSDKRKENIRKIMMAQTAQLLESMTSLYRSPDGGLIPKPGQIAGGNGRKRDGSNGSHKEEAES